MGGSVVIYRNDGLIISLAYDRNGDSPSTSGLSDRRYLFFE